MTDIASKLEHAYCTAGLPPENPIRLAAARLRELEAECERLAADNERYIGIAATYVEWVERQRALLREAREFIDTTRDPAYPAGAALADRIDAALLAKEGA